MKELSKISELYDNYDGFILDIWGVIHDGQAVYPGVIECMRSLREAGKEVVFLSNAPRRAGKVKSVLAKFGITEDLYKDVLSSGEVAYQELSKHASGNSKYYYIGPDKDRDLLEGLGFTEVNNPEEAAFAVTTGFDNDNSTLDEKLPQIEIALALKMKMFCVNPDLIVVRQNGSKMLCAGVIGEYYRQNGGEVEFIGKPYSKIYEYAFAKFSSGIKKLRIVAVGDGFDTDILGAANVGIDSVLCLGGILSVTGIPVAELVERFGISPSYTIAHFN